MVFVLRGRAVHVVDGCTHPFGAGDVLLIRGGRTHYYRDLEDASLLCLLIAPQFDAGMSDPGRVMGDFAEIFLPSERNTGSREHLTPAPGEFRRALAQMLALEAELGQQPVIPSRIRERFRQILGIIARCSATARARQSTQHMIPHYQTVASRLTPAFKHLEQHFAEPMRLDRLAEQATLPLRTFLRQFHAVTGRAPFVYLHDLRLHHAMLELKRTKRHITEVALGAGFNDLSFFNRKFKLVAGLPPTIWRQKRPHEW